MRARRGDQVANHPDAALGGPKAESKLVGRSHCREFTGAGLCREWSLSKIGGGTKCRVSVDGRQRKEVVEPLWICPYDTRFIREIRANPWLIFGFLGTAFMR